MVRRGRRPGVLRADVDRYLERARIQPGGIAASRAAGEFRSGKPVTNAFANTEPYTEKRTVDVPGLAEATILRDERGWTDADLAQLLGVHDATVHRRRLKGFSPEQVERMRREITDDRGW